MVCKWGSTDGSDTLGVEGSGLLIWAVKTVSKWHCHRAHEVLANRGSGSMTKLRNSLILVAAWAILCLPATAVADTTVKAKLVELNGSGASGTATLTATGNGGLKVVIRSQGLVPGVFHPQHIHGTAHGGHFMCPTLKENDKDGDGYLTNEEGTGEYGTIFFALTTRGGFDAAGRARRHQDAGRRLSGTNQLRTDIPGRYGS